MKNYTSDKDEIGGFTHSSQDLHNKVSNTIGGEIPSHWVFNCNCLLFN